MKVKTYTQCTLQRFEGTSKITTVSWLPSQYANLNRKLSLKVRDRDQWDDWTVVQSGTTKDARYIEEDEDDWRDYIKNTDI